MNFWFLRSLLARILSLILASYLVRSEGVNISSGLSGGVAGWFDAIGGLLVGKIFSFRKCTRWASSGGDIFRRDGISENGEAVE